MTESEVLSLDLTGIRRLTVADFAERRMTNQEFFHIAGLVGGYWEYLGEPRFSAPHMLAQSGLHLGNYINCSLILAESTVREILAAQMIRYCPIETNKIDWVVTAALAGITLGGEIARQLRARDGFVEKGDDKELSAWRFQILAGESVLLVNELITTPDGSIYATKQTVEKLNPELVRFLPYAALMVDRCPSKTLADGTQIRSLFKFVFPAYPESGCPYCAAGSSLVRGKANFRRLWQEQQAYQREQQGGNKAQRRLS